MSILPFAFAALLASTDASPPASLLSSLTFDLEIGPGYVIQNDNQYGATGTRYTAEEVGQRRNLFVSKRLSLELGLAERHRVIFLYAPFDLTTRATLGRDLDFNGTVFREGEVVDHRYLFEGYRASYLYGLVRAQRLHWDVGGSVQVRNASVELRSVAAPNARFAVESDIGLVVAVKTRLTWRPTEAFWTTFEADAISAFGLFDGSGALYDLSLSAGTPVRRGADAFLRLRFLGGGAEVPRREIYNWGNFFFATAGVRTDLMSL